ncbi:MAG TPA: proton-conducting transporter membrane subunit, partial [Deinococcales bacterium]|nr:proton-conducting transporter membrane subunit [Deinococcales bacterium]
MSPDINWLVLSPALTILVTAALALLYSLSDGDTRGGAAIALVGAAFAGVLNYALYMTDGTLSSFGGRFLADSTAVLLNFVILAGLVIAILASWNYVRRADLEQPEYYPLMLLASVGAMVMSASGDLITLVLGLEIMSLAVYVLSAWRDGNSRAARHSQEAGMKYFLLGATGSAVFIYGIALTYGATGEFSWQALTAAAQAPDFSQPLLLALGVLMLLAGLGFKAAVFPFHQWAADAYTGAPMPVTAFMSVVVKTAAFAALLRLAAEFLPLASPAAFEAFV